MMQSTLKYSLLGVSTALLYFTIVLLFGNASIGQVALKSVLFYIIVAPIVEECLFRGLLQPFIRSKINYNISFISVANIITSIFFAFLHLFYFNILQSMLVFIPSLFLGVLYERSRSIVPPIATHAVFNLNIFILY